MLAIRTNTPEKDVKQAEKIVKNILGEKVQRIIAGKYGEDIIIYIFNDEKISENKIEQIEKELEKSKIEFKEIDQMFRRNKFTYTSTEGLIIK